MHKLPLSKKRIVLILITSFVTFIFNSFFKFISTDYIIPVIIGIVIIIYYFTRYEKIQKYIFSHLSKILSVNLNIKDIKDTISNMATYLLLIVVLYLGYIFFNMLFPPYPNFPINPINNNQKMSINILVMKFNNNTNKLDNIIGTKLRDTITLLLQTNFCDSIKNIGGIDTVIVKSSRKGISTINGNALDIGEKTKADFIIFGDITNISGTGGGIIKPWICITNKALKKDLLKLQTYMGEVNNIQLADEEFSKVFFVDIKNICMLLKGFTLLETSHFLEGRIIIENIPQILHSNIKNHFLGKSFFSEYLSKLPELKRYIDCGNRPKIDSMYTLRSSILSMADSCFLLQVNKFDSTYHSSYNYLGIINFNRNNYILAQSYYEKAFTLTHFSNEDYFGNCITLDAIMNDKTHALKMLQLSRCDDSYLSKMINLYNNTAGSSSIESTRILH